MKKFDGELRVLQKQLVEMGTMSEAMIALAVGALIDRDTGPIEALILKEQAMDRLHVDIDEEAIRLLTVYTPVAADLRCLLMISRINSELERIGDQCVNMCEYIRLLVQEPELKPLVDLPRMAELTSAMVHGSLEAFIQRDDERARAIRNSDDDVDALNDKICTDLMEYAGVPENMRRVVALILTARSLERIADHATNICEEIVYLVLGKDIRHMEELARRPAATAGSD